MFDGTLDNFEVYDYDHFNVRGDGTLKVCCTSLVGSLFFCGAVGGVVVERGCLFAPCHSIRFVDIVIYLNFYNIVAVHVRAAPPPLYIFFASSRVGTDGRRSCQL